MIVNAFEIDSLFTQNFFHLLLSFVLYCLYIYFSSLNLFYRFLLCFDWIFDECGQKFIEYLHCNVVTQSKKFNWSEQHSNDFVTIQLKRNEHEQFQWIQTNKLKSWQNILFALSPNIVLRILFNCRDGLFNEQLK